MVATAPFASPADVARIWRPLTDDETIVALGLLGAASQLIVEIPAVAVRILAETVADATLRYVCAQMVQRVMLNPDRLRQFTISVDDASRSGVYDDAVTSGELMITESELDRLLGRIPVGAQSGAFTIRPWEAPAAAAVTSPSLWDIPFPPWDGMP